MNSTHLETPVTSVNQGACNTSMHRVVALLVWLSFLTSSTPTSLFADTIELVLGGSYGRDTTIAESTAGDLANGMGSGLCVGNTGQGLARRALLQFPLDGQLPLGATINSVELRLFMSQTNAGNESITLHRIEGDWGEGASAQSGCQSGTAQTNDATWLYRFYQPLMPSQSLSWSAAGGDFSATVSAATNVGGSGSYTWSGGGMVADVVAWLNDPGNNFGWLMLGSEVGSPTAKRFDSREATVADRRPTLTIDYDPPAMVGACCFTDGNCSVVTATECSTLGGEYQGDGSNCSPNPCVPFAVGACCFSNGTCEQLSSLQCELQGGVYQGDGVECAPNLCPLVLDPYLDALPIPPVAIPTTGAQGGTATYQIAVTQFSQQLHAQLPPTTVWGYGVAGSPGTFPGPTIEAVTEEPVTVEWINDLRDSSGNFLAEHLFEVDLCPHGADTLPRVVTHLHGGHVPAEFDGYPEDTFLPGESDTYVYPNNQPPATLWYHDHSLGVTRLNVYAGLAGFYLIRDTAEVLLGLPSGPFEIPLVIQDRSFNPDGSWKYPAVWQDHFFGDHILVNGKVWPHLEVRQGKYRLRILNGSNSRTYRLALSTLDEFLLIGSDGGLLSAPVPMTELLLAPAERADVVVDFALYSPGTEILLTNSAPAPYPGTPGEGVVPQVMQFRVIDQVGDTDPIPTSLTPVETIEESEAVRTREFVLRKQLEACAGSRWLINDLHWNAITEEPILGTTEIWSFANSSGITHPMHMHLVLFQVLDRQSFQMVDGEVVTTGPRVTPGLDEQGWKDTVQVHPFEITRVIARFEDYSGLFAYHCHILEHEDHEMMRQFRVVLPKSFIRGDTNNDGQFGLTDVLVALNYLFLGGSLPCTVAADCNADGQIGLTDTLYALGGLFTGGQLPPAPYPACGVDAVGESTLGCGASGCP